MLVNTNVEFEDEDCVIYGVRTNFLPLKNGSKINLQGALIKEGKSSTLIIGYPALPLESY